MDPIESEGASVAEAVEAALRRLGLRREQVEVDILQEGAPGFMGIGAKPARVRLTEKRWGAAAAPAAPAPAPAARPPSRPASSAPRPPSPAPRPRAPAPRPQAPAARPPAPAEPRPPRDEAPRDAAPRAARPPRGSDAPRPVSKAEADAACARAQALLVELLRQMKIAAPTVTCSWDAAMERVKAVVESQDATALVGRDGRVLESLQFLATLMLSRGAETPVAVQVDALSYWEKREAAFLDQARNAAESVKATGRPYRLEPMDAAMRRLIHRTLASSPDVTTSSEGEGPWRKIVIRPRKD
jgi:spoIIIJ-associated protein